MAKKAKRIEAWKKIIILLPLIVGIMWAIALFTLRDDIPVVYEQASPASVGSLLLLVLLFVFAYGTFAFIVLLRKSPA